MLRISFALAVAAAFSLCAQAAPVKSVFDQPAEEPAKALSSGRILPEASLKDGKRMKDAFASYASAAAAFGSSFCSSAGCPDDLSSPEALSLVKACLGMYVFTPESLDWSEFKAISERWRKTASPSPALNVWIAFALWGGGDWKEATARLDKSLKALGSSSNGKEMEFVARFFLSKMGGGADPAGNAASCVKALAAAASSGRSEAELELFLSLATSFGDSSHGPTMASLDAALDAIPAADPWFAACVKGEAEINRAWAARGDGWAKEVTDEGWKGFEKHLKLASESLRKAWTSQPGRPFAPFKMMTVAMASSETAGGSVKTWLQRSLAARLDYYPALDQYLYARSPRWGGSHEEMLKLGEECLDTGLFDSCLPEIYADALYRVADEQESFAWRKPFRKPGVKERITKLFDGLLAARGSKEQLKSRLLLQYAYCLAWTGDYEGAQAKLDAVPKDFSSLEGIANRGAARCQFREDLEGEIALFAGPSKELAMKWDAALHSGDKEASKKLAYELLGECNDSAVRAHILLRSSQMMTGETPDSWRHSYDQRPLFFALNYKKRDAMEFLLDNGASPNQLSSAGDWTAFSLAVSRRDFESADYLLTWGADPSVANAKGETPIMALSRSGRPEAVEYLLSKGVDINQPKSGGATPVTFAAVDSNIPVLKLLIAKGADVKLHETDNYSPLLYASRSSNFEVAKILVEAGAEIDRKTNDGNTPFLLAVAKGNVRIAKLLLESGADVNALNGKGLSALHMAAGFKSPEMLELLLSKGAAKEAKAPDGRTALDIAKAAGLQANVDALSK